MKTVGILGGGQLGMMLAEAIKKLGGRSICLDPNPKCPCSYVCDEVIVSEYDDLDGINKLASKSDVLTYEFENIPADKLNYIADKFNILQGVKPLFDSQNRIREKENAKVHGLNTPKFYRITSLSDLNKGIEELGYPCVYKTTTLGYDGHGQVVLKSSEDIKKVEPFLNGEGILEEFIKFDYETSIIMIRDKEKTVYLPMGINYHKNGILDLCVIDKKKDIFDKIVQDSIHFMKSCNYYGILTIEFFVKGDNYYFNEMAPRPHNSGHYSIEGTTCSQYELLARFLLGEPLRESKLKGPTIMKNILGFDYDNLNKVVINDDIFVHDYHKKDVKEKRKMAHITFTNMSIEEYNNKYKKLFCEE